MPSRTTRSTSGGTTCAHGFPAASVAASRREHLGLAVQVGGEPVRLHDARPFVEQGGQRRIGHVHPAGQMSCRIDDLAQHLLDSEGAQRRRVVEVGVAEFGEPARVGAREMPRVPAASTSASAAGSRSVYLRATIAAWASDCAIPATSRAAGIGSIRCLRRQYRVAVEVGDHEPPVAAQHLPDVQIAVSLDDRRARERTEPVRACASISPRRVRAAMSLLTESLSAQAVSSARKRRAAPARRVRAIGHASRCRPRAACISATNTPTSAAAATAGPGRGVRARAAAVTRSTAHVQPSTAPGRYSSTLATSVSAPSGGLPGDQAPRGGHARRTRRRATG